MSNGTHSPDSIRKLDHEEPQREENDIEIALDAIPALLDKIEHDLKVNLTSTRDAKVVLQLNIITRWNGPSLCLVFTRALQYRRHLIHAFYPVSKRCANNLV
jgi:hypothetical protein